MVHEISLVACARWESRYILEWIAYHRSIGFSHIYLYCNDDDPRDLYRMVLPLTLGESPFVTFNYFPEIGQQKQMYLHFLYNYKKETKWFSFLDIDEFIRIPGHSSISEFLYSCGQTPDCIYFNWCWFGSNGHITRPDGDVLVNYTRRIGHYYNYMTKHITRSESIDVKKIGLGPMSDFWHYWNSYEDFDQLTIINVVGDDMKRYYENIDKTKAKLAKDEYYNKLIETGIINHYGFKSRTDFLLRAERGTSGDFSQQEAYRQHYITGRVDEILPHFDVVEDRFLADYWFRLLSQWQVAKLPEPKIESVGSISSDEGTESSRFLQPKKNIGSFWRVVRDYNDLNLNSDEIDLIESIAFEGSFCKLDFEFGSTISLAEIDILFKDHIFEGLLENFELLFSLDKVHWDLLDSDQKHMPKQDFQTRHVRWRAVEVISIRFLRIKCRRENFPWLTSVKVYGAN